MRLYSTFHPSMLRLEVEKFTPLRHPGRSGNVGVCPRFPIRNPPSAFQTRFWKSVPTRVSGMSNIVLRLGETFSHVMIFTSNMIISMARHCVFCGILGLCVYRAILCLRADGMMRRMFWSLRGILRARWREARPRPCGHNTVLPL